KTEHNTDFHQIVDFLEAFHIRIETTDQETKIIATIDGKPRTISESSLRRHLKLNDEEGISSLPDAELFEHLSLMGYNILPNQRIVPLFASMIVAQGEGSTNPTEPHHTPSPQEHHSPQHDSPPLAHQRIIPKPIPHDLQAPTETLTPRRLTKRTIRIAQSKALSPDADEPASLSRGDRHGETFPTISSLDAGQDRENIAKTFAMPMNHYQGFLLLMLMRADIEISGLKARVKSLEDKERRREEPIQEDAPITRGIIDIEEELRADKSTEKRSTDSEEMVNVLSLMEAVNILSSGGAAVLTASVSPADVFPTAGVLTVSGSFPTVSVIFTTASVVTPYTRRSRGITTGSLQPMRILIISTKDKGKEKVTETKVPKKKKLQEQIDAQVAREMEEGFARENQRLSVQAVSDSEIARIHAEEELKLMIEGLDRSNEEENERVKRPGIKLDQRSSKRVKISRTPRLEPSQEQQFKGSKGVSKEELKGMMQLVPLEEVYIEAVQVKHPIIDWEIHPEGKREYWKIIILGGHTGAYQFFVDMLKQFDREDLHQL
nr:hypothetical protein [Tanacetum cinerariifolium]